MEFNFFFEGAVEVKMIQMLDSAIRGFFLFATNAARIICRKESPCLCFLPKSLEKAPWLTHLIRWIAPHGKAKAEH
jgi:hypothetical protein